MSFPRAAVKRFNETASVAPAPGHYDVQGKDSVMGGISFASSSSRFKSTDSVPSDCGHEPVSKEFAAPAPLPSSSSKRKLNFGGTKAKSAEKRPDSARSSPNVTAKEKQTYEREIRQLLQQCSEREKDLKHCREEILKLQNKQVTLTKDKLSLETQLVSVQKSAEDLEKKNKLLESQKIKAENFGDVEKELKKTKAQLSSYTHQMELDRVKLSNMEADLGAAETRISALQEANSDLEKLNKEIEMHGNEVTRQVDRLQGITDKLRLENCQLQNKLESTQCSLHQVENGFREIMQTAVETCVRNCNEKIQLSDKSLLELQQRVDDANKMIGGLNEHITTLKSDKLHYKKESSELKEKVSVLHNECSLLTERSRDLTCQVEEKSKEVDAAKEEISSLNDTLSRMQQQIESSTKEGEETLYAVTSECDLLKNQLDKECRGSVQLEGQVQEFTEEIRVLRADLVTAQQQKDIVLKKLEESKENVTSVQSDRDDLASKLEMSESENAILSKRGREIAEDLEEYKKKLIESEKISSQLETRCISAEESARCTNDKAQEYKSLIEALRQELEDAGNQHDAKLKEFTRRILDTQKKLNQRECELKVAKDELTASKDELDQLVNSNNKEKAEQKQTVARLEEENASMESELSQATSQLQELQLKQADFCNDEMNREINKWKRLYEELQEKVQPFQSQLDAYSAEKSMLLSETTAAQQEMNQLGRKYAELLGHHNQKQKIKHIVKIKEENMSLKQEINKLRTQVSNLQKRALENRKPRFDPSKAFQHQKENTNPN